MATSQNGYKANDRSLIASYTIPGSSVKISLRKGDVSVVLLHFAAWFHKNISPLSQKDTGGYAERTIRGSSTTLSNHASGTAEDLDWNAHPLGKDNTFSDADEAKIQKQLKFYEGVIRWGGNYSGRKDEMHFEINKGLSDVARVAKKCKGSAAKPPAKPGARVPLKVDGGLGPKTILRWQEVMKQTKSGSLTSTFIKAVQSRLNSTVGARLAVDGKGIAQNGKKTKTIEALQRYLKSPVDGVMSKPDSHVVRALQRRLNEGRF